MKMNSALEQNTLFYIVTLLVCYLVGSNPFAPNIMRSVWLLVMDATTFINKRGTLAVENCWGVRKSVGRDSGCDENRELEFLPLPYTPVVIADRYVVRTTTVSPSETKTLGLLCSCRFVYWFPSRTVL